MVDTATGDVSHLEKGLGGPTLTFAHLDHTEPGPPYYTGRAFLISALGLHSRGVETPNALLGVLIFVGGLGQYLAAFGATLWASYSAFNFSYAMVYFPGTGILAAYTDAEIGAPRPEFDQAIAVHLWAGFSRVLSINPSFLSLGFLLLAVAHITGDEGAMTAGYSVMIVTAALSYWASCAGLWAGGTTPISLPMSPMYKEVQLATEGDLMRMDRSMESVI
ncbi:GPR1/FUN34/yaaH family-domain-containing protein [Aspergillus navahoensis]